MDGEQGLKARMLDSLAVEAKLSIAGFLRGLVEQGVVRPEQVKAWGDVRNSVMHGTLVSPWSTEEGDEQIRHLAGLVHNLTLEHLRRAPY